MAEPETEPAIDTFNKFMVGAIGDDLVVVRAAMLSRISKQDALLLAAYLVTMVGDDEQWARTLKAVENT